VVERKGREMRKCKGRVGSHDSLQRHTPSDLRTFH
jgi:hypothetical protein